MTWQQQLRRRESGKYVEDQSLHLTLQKMNLSEATRQPCSFCTLIQYICEDICVCIYNYISTPHFTNFYGCYDYRPEGD